MICNSCYHRNPLHLTNCVNCGMELAETREVTKVTMEIGQSKETGPLTPSNETYSNLLEKNSLNM